MGDRLEELEVRFSYQEKLIAELDGVIRELRDVVDRLRSDVEQLQGQATVGPVEDGVPPHW